MTSLWTSATSQSWTQPWWCLRETCGSCSSMSRWGRHGSLCWRWMTAHSRTMCSDPRTDRPTRWFICVCSPQRGTYLPQTYIIQEEMMVTGRVRNMRQLGPFIHRLCYGKETYRLRRRNLHRRECSHTLPFLALRRYEMVNDAWSVTSANISPSFTPTLAGVKSRERAWNKNNQIGTS